MTIQEAHYDFKTKLDKVDSLKKRNFLTHEIDWILNEAQLMFLKTRSDQNNVNRTGFETTSKRKTDLRTLQIKSPGRQPGLVPVLAQVDVYELPIDNFEYKCFKLTNLTVKAEKNDCTKLIYDVKAVQHDDLNEYLRRDFYKPSFNWSRIIYVEGSGSVPSSTGSIYLYTDGFNIIEVYPEYLKLPEKVWFGNYNSLDGQYLANIDSPVSFEFPEAVHNEIVDLAVAECSRIIEHPTFYQLKQQKFQLNE